MKKIAIILLAAALVAGCGGRKKAPVVVEPTFEEAIDAAHNSLNSLDYLGTYTGVLPCADCEGIRTTIVLGEDDYTIKLEYLGKGGGKVEESSGEYSWDDTGDVITLHNEPKTNKYKVGENRLFKLDENDKVVEGKLADKYILTKVM